MVSKDALLKVKQDVESYIGQEIFVKANIGRNKCIFKRGTIDSTYTNLYKLWCDYFYCKIFNKNIGNLCTKVAKI